MTKFPLAHRMGAYSWNYVDLKKIQKVVRVCVYESEFVDQDECLLYFLKKKKTAFSSQDLLQEEGESAWLEVSHK